MLERAGLISRMRSGQARPCRLRTDRLKHVADWLKTYRHFWEQSFDRLETYLCSKSRQGRTMTVTDPTDRPTLVLTRVFAAPRALVFRAWTEPERAALWWGPQGFEILSCHMDVRPGGSWRMALRRQTGQSGSNKAFTLRLHRRNRRSLPGKRLDPAGLPGQETIVTVTFEQQGSGTKLTLQQATFETAEIRDEHHAGWSGCMDRFAEYIANT